MICPTCGMQNENNAKFCGRCGTQLQSMEQPMNNHQSNGAFLNNNQSNNNMFPNNNQNFNGSNFKLTLNRPKSFVGSLIKFKIFIDDIQVGTIKNGETVVLNVQGGAHTISFNKTMNQNLNINSDTYADVVVIASNRFGLSNIRDSSGSNIQNNNIVNENIDKIVKSARGPLIFSCACILITFILLFTVEKVIAPWMYGLSIGYSIISLSSINNNKQSLGDKYKSLLTLNIISIVISVIGSIISIYLMIG